MILQALYDYYQRKLNGSEGDIAPEGFGYVEIPFLIHLTKDGTFSRFEDTRKEDGKKFIGRKFLVPVLSVTRTSGIVANLFWDNAKYCLGLPDPKKVEKINKDWEKLAEALQKNNASEDTIKENKEEKLNKPLKKASDDAEKFFSSFVKNIEDKNYSNIPSVQILLRFLKGNPIEQIKSKIDCNNEIWKEICSKVPNVTFWVDGDSEPVVSALYLTIKESRISVNKKEYQGVCLITGEKTSIEPTHPVIKNIRNAQPSGAAIISFNNASFTSFNKDQNFNAPVSKSATFAYTTALNTLLDKKSRNKMQVGDMTMVFWSEKSNQLEDIFSDFWSFPIDNPDADIEAVRKLYSSINTGVFIQDSNARFYLLGLSPNAARIAIRYWQIGTVDEVSQKIKQYFDDLKIATFTEDRGRCALMSMLGSLVRKPDDLPPALCGDMFKAAVQGTSYPQSLLQLCIRRNRTDFDPDSNKERIRMRAALLKAFLNRNCKTSDKEITVSLDKNNTNPGYLLGRLFAAFERLQERAQGGKLNSTIKDRYYGAASSTPNTAFPQLTKLHIHHLAKLENTGERVNFEKLIGEIMEGISSKGYPAQLSLEDQARFAIGYYHQRQDIFKSKEEK
jgi:CRISPR-associated protein Csd1